MAWAGFPKVSLGDIAGAVNKLQESVKSIEKNFDTALGLDKLQAAAADKDAKGEAPPQSVVAKPAINPLDGWGWGATGVVEAPGGVAETAEAAQKTAHIDRASAPGPEDRQDDKVGGLVERLDKSELSLRPPVVVQASHELAAAVSGQSVASTEQSEQLTKVGPVFSARVAEEGNQANEAAPPDSIGEATLKQEEASAHEEPSESGARHGESHAEMSSGVKEDAAETPAVSNVVAEENLPAAGDQVTLARIVAGVTASQPYGHGESAQEEVQKSPKMAVADAFPSMAAPQFKPHAEVDSVAEFSTDAPKTSTDLSAREPSVEDSLSALNKSESLEQEPETQPKGQAVSTSDGNVDKGVEETSSVSSSANVGGSGERGASNGGPFPRTSVVLESFTDQAPLDVLNETKAASHPHVSDDKEVSSASKSGGKGSVRSGESRQDGDQQAVELAHLKEQLASMEAALQHAAKQAQTKANELAEMGQANDNLRAELQEVKGRKADESDLEALRAEYQHRLGTAERKVYALTKERDMLRRESSRKSDTSTLLKEKDEIIKQVMAEGEELSKKQAAVEGQMRKLRGSIRELEMERDRLLSKLQVEEAKTESISKDKAKTERQLADAVERAQAELAAQKDSFTAALQETREQLAKAEAAADSTKRSELDKQVKEAAEREAELVRQLEEVREQMTRDAQAAATREDRLRRDVRELEARCQDAEARHSELVARVPDSTRPLLRQIEALQEAASSRGEAWSAVERTLNARVQEAEVAAAGSQERERAAAERLTQAASRMAVMEAQVSMLRAEQSALQRSLEKERGRAAETRQELLALKEAAAVHEGRAAQVEEEMKDLRAKHKKDAQEAARRRDALEQEVESLRMEHDKLRAGQASPVLRVQNGTAGGDVAAEGGSERKMSRRPSNASSAGSSMEEGYYLQASLQGAPFLGALEGAGTWGGSTRGGSSAGLVGQLEALLRQREGELASHASRLASLESTRDALAEELVKTTQQTEELAKQAAALPSLRAELDALRRRHASALELMGERDEEVEELRADLQDHKSMYREQIDMLVKQIERQGKTSASHS